ncbi:MAG: D-alanyl-D-alanine carboxypeptidase/D-alanyl-D-alanine-endopeptidase [Elusimicrobiota bacterium]|jgi:D-alanyl-D-alanine carboxypeptidase/D-alanyl-D-alanine-endopeptidase (penicillin-binding protein 4)|nr:D-alanyl-D-alanine carboxypeptidase/D-alanyl-D-alanine-endopeptidase [Elusimicrobiota bacterium]
MLINAAGRGKIFFKLILAAFTLIFCLQPLFALEDIQNILNKYPQLKGAQTSVYAKYIDGAEIISLNPDLRLAPASVLKLYTTAAALDILGPDFTFETKLYYSGKIKKKRIKGDIYIKGGGDPTLGSRRIAATQNIEALTDTWVETIKSLGVKRIDGNIYADNTIFSGVLYPWHTTYQNIGNYFAAPVDGLSILDNSYDIYFEPSLEDGSHANVLRTDPPMDGLIIQSKATIAANPSGGAYANYLPGIGAVVVYGKISTSKRSLEISAAMPSPALFFADYFKNKLELAGIKVKGDFMLASSPNYEDKTLILTHSSPELREIIKYTNKRSFNLYADTLLRTLSVKNGGAGTAQAGASQVKDYLNRLGLESSGVNILDGGGLGRDNITTCRLTVSLLEKVLKTPYKDDFVASIPRAGDPEDIGSVARRMKHTSAAHNALIKTGALNKVRAHAGYLKDSKNRKIVFCIVSNNFDGSAREINAPHEEIICKLSDIGLNKKPTARRPKRKTKK